MASPFRHPQTGAYYLRRKLPADVCSAFGGKELYKATLDTKDLATARTRFILANAELERRIIDARTGIMFSPLLCIKQWFGQKRGKDQSGSRRKLVVLMRLDLAVSDFDAAVESTGNWLAPIRDWDRWPTIPHCVRGLSTNMRTPRCA